MEVSMQNRYIAPAIMLIAGCITSIINIVNGIDLYHGLIKMLVVLIIFFIIGKIAAKVIEKVTTEKTVVTPENQIVEQQSSDEEATTISDITN
jgi:multisubunit Na+/H+ antiporter MnhG subunit